MKDAIRRCLLALTAAPLALACGGDGRDKSGQPPSDDSATPPATEFVWPEGPRDVALLEVEGRGTIRIALYPEIAPKTVENFTKLAREGFYDGTTFHRVIPDFMIQGGDPNTRDKLPDNDGKGGPGYTIDDEFSTAPHVRGVISMANRGRENSGGSQFFIVQRHRPDLDGRYAVFGRVIDGMEIVDAIAGVEVDKHGRWGPKNRPLENVVIQTIRIEPAASTQAGGQPSSGGETAGTEGTADPSDMASGGQASPGTEEQTAAESPSA